MFGNIKSIDSRRQFDTDVRKSTRPVVVDFYAAWSPDSRQFEDTFCQLEQQYGSDITFLRLDTDDQTELAHEYEIKVIPTVILFANGRVANQWFDEKDVDQYRLVFDSVLTGKTT